MRIVKLHNAVAIGITEKTGPALTPRVAGRLEPQRRAEGAIIKITAQGTGAVHREPIVPGQRRGYHADAAQRKHVLLVLQVAGQPLLERTGIAIVDPLTDAIEDESSIAFGQSLEGGKFLQLLRRQVLFLRLFEQTLLRFIRRRKCAQNLAAFFGQLSAALVECIAVVLYLGQ